MPVLTAITVANFKPRERRYEVRDTRSTLRLVVFPTGKKSWVIRFRRRDGRSGKFTLGRVNTTGTSVGPVVVGNPLTLAEARKLAAEIELKRASGSDPARQVTRTDDAPTTFAAAARTYIDEYAARKTRKWKITARFLGLDPDGAVRPKGLCDLWHNKPISEVTGNDIHRVVSETRKYGVPGLERRSEGMTDGQARWMHGALSKLFAWLVAQRVITMNPCTGVDRPKPAVPRERVLSDPEIRALWAACGDGTFGSALKVMLITGARRDEVSGMRHDELSADGTVWTLSPSRTKNKREHTITLPALAREIIAALPVRGDYVFTANGRTPVRGWDFFKRGIDARIGIADWRLHDLRRTAVTGMARAGADLHVIERSVNHASGSFGGIVGVYQKHRYADEVTRALEAWSNLLQQIVKPTRANVVALRG